MKKILLLILLIPVLANIACSPDVVYEDAYGHIEKQDEKTTSVIVGSLNREVDYDAKIKAKALVSNIITKETPLGYSSGMQWKTAGKYASSFFSRWLDSWRSMNVEYFLSHYSKDFNNGENDFNSWAKDKRRLSKNKKYINVSATSVSLLKHPQKDITAVTYFQDYRSNNFSDQSWKRQFWKKDADERWRIVYEGEIEGPFTPFVKRFNN